MATGVLLLAAPAAGQGGVPVGLEVRGGFANPSGEWNESDLFGTGTGYGLAAHVQALPFLAVYLGWDRLTFEVEDQATAGAELRWVDSGPHAGVAVTLPLPGPITPYGMGGITLPITTRRTATSTGTRSIESEQAFGFEVGGGVEIALGEVLSVTPAVRYRTHSAEWDSFTELTAVETTISYLLFDVGLRLRR